MLLNDKKALGELAGQVKAQLLHQVLPFWLAHTPDPRGGYHTCLDRWGNLIEDEKNIWMQARQVWLFSSVYRQAAPEERYLTLARQGRDYLLSGGAYAGAGRWNYRLSPGDGRALEGTVSLYTDCFCLMALCGYAQASGDRGDLPLIQSTFEALEKNLLNPDCRDVFPQTWQPDQTLHGLPMIGLNAAAQAAPILGKTRVTGLMTACLAQLFNILWDEKSQAFLEIKARDGSVLPGPAGQALNPGHNFEGAWFIMTEAEGLGRGDLADRAAKLVAGLWPRAHDPQGGVFYMLDAGGKEPGPCDWHPLRALKWDEKVWWTHAEALCALLHAARRLNSQSLFEEFQALWAYCLAHFADPEAGEWYFVLHRDGTPRLTQKGGLQKAAFHVPRSLMQCYLLLKEMSQS